MGTDVYCSADGRGLDLPATSAHLGVLRGRNHWAWILYWFRRDVRWRVPARCECISQTRIVATFHATVGDGTICVVWLDDV